MLTDGRGVPVAVVPSGANRHGMKKLGGLPDAVAVERPAAPAGRIPAQHPCLDRGDDYVACRAAAEARASVAHIPPKSSEAAPLPPPGHPDRHPPRRRVVEVAHVRFNRFRRLPVRWEKRAANHLAFVHPAACLIAYRTLRHVRLPSG